MRRALLAAAAVAALALPAQAQTMDQVIEGAKKEGKLVIHVGPGKNFRDGRLNGFEAKYPWLKVEASNVADREQLPKLIRERQAGLFQLDVHLGGTPSLLRVFKPQGFLHPFDDAIVDKSLRDDSKWRGGWAGGYQDLEKKYVYAYQMVTNMPGHVNWAGVKKSELKGIKDLLDKKYAGKILWQDPRSPGPGFAAATLLYVNFGEEFMTKLFAQQATYINNRRQAAEFVVRGRYPIGIGTSRDFMLPFEQQGLTKSVEEMPDEWIPQPTMSAGNGNIVFMDRAPHPNAAKLYINWFLQKEQQQQWNKVTDGASRRLDTTPNDAHLAPDPNKKYVDIRHESQADLVDKVLKLARSAIKAERDPNDVD
jgi:iron(III) transport system substrate-binding protein